MAATVLVVEDEAFMQRLASYILEALGGYRVLIASHGREALATLEAETGPGSMGVDLVLCDISMPEMSGLDVLHTIRRTPRLADLPVVMCTARGEKADRSAAVEAGADGYILKPFSSHELLSLVKRHLEAARPST